MHLSIQYWSKEIVCQGGSMARQHLGGVGTWILWNSYKTKQKKFSSNKLAYNVCMELLIFLQCAAIVCKVHLAWIVCSDKVVSRSQATFFFYIGVGKKGSGILNSNFWFY